MADPVKPPEVQASPAKPLTLEDHIDGLLKAIGSNPGETELEKAMRESVELKAQIDLLKAQVGAQVKPATTIPMVQPTISARTTAAVLEQERAALRARESDLVKGLNTDQMDATRFVTESLSLLKSRFEHEDRYAVSTQERLSMLEKSAHDQGDMISKFVNTFTNTQMVILKALTTIAENTKASVLPAAPANLTPQQQVLYNQLGGILLGKSASNGRQSNPEQKPKVDMAKLEKALFQKKIDESVVKFVKQTGQLPDGVTLD